MALFHLECIIASFCSHSGRCSIPKRHTCLLGCHLAFYPQAERFDKSHLALEQSEPFGICHHTHHGSALFDVPSIKSMQVCSSIQRPNYTCSCPQDVIFHQFQENQLVKAYHILLWDHKYNESHL